MLLLSGERRLLGLPRVRRELSFLLKVGTLFIQFQLLFLRQQMIGVGEEMGGEVRILCCLVEGMLCLAHLILEEEVSYQIHQ